MQIFENIHGKPLLRPHALTDKEATAVSLGFFDGVHVGHKALLERCVALAEEKGYIPAAISFRHLSKKAENGLLLTEDERMEAIFSTGIRIVFLLDFEKIADLSPVSFVSEILLSLCHAKALLCGEDFRFGKAAVGTPKDLSAELPTEVIPKLRMEGDAISATRIRRVLAEGETALAARLLGSPFRISGAVQHGKAVGRMLGFPTLNVPLTEEKFCPRTGVYLSRVTLDEGSYFAVTNIGLRPTLESSDIPNAESHLFGFSREAYGETATVELLHFLRPEIRFASADALKEQIERDKEEAQKWMSAFTQS